jgi:hypothetical protein
MSLEEEILEGKIEAMYKRGKYASCFVFKEDRMPLRLIVEVRNGMVDWPVHYQVLIFIQSLCTRLYYKFHGQQLPI